MYKLEMFKNILQEHYGKGNSISAGEIEQLLGYPTEDTHSKGRRLVERCTKKYGMPVSGDVSGYFIITNENELNEYKLNLQSRVKKINAREQMIEKNFREWNK